MAPARFPAVEKLRSAITHARSLGVAPDAAFAWADADALAQEAQEEMRRATGSLRARAGDALDQILYGCLSLEAKAAGKHAVAFESARRLILPVAPVLSTLEGNFSGSAWSRAKGDRLAVAVLGQSDAAIERLAAEEIEAARLEAAAKILAV